MLKKLLFSLFLLSGILGIHAQHVPGSWKVIPMTGFTFEYVQDTPDKVYYLSGGSLYSYDKQNNETIYYAPGVRISDSGIKFLRYNGDKKYLVLVYDNCNIDLIYDNGKIINLPEIKDSNLTMAKAVNNVQFGKDRIYVATSFGIVIYDDKDHFVIESGIYNKNINEVFELGDYVLVFDNTKLKYSPKRDRHNSLDKFTDFASLGNRYIIPVSDNSYFTLVANGTNEDLYKFTITDFDNKSYNLEKLATVPGGKGIFKYKNGYYVPGNDGFYLTEGLEYSRKESYPTTFSSQTLSFWDNPSTFWAGDATGIGSYTLANGTVTAKNEKYFPTSSKQNNLWFSANSPDLTEVYINGAPQSENNPGSYYSNAVLLESYNWTTGEIEPKYPIVEKQYSSTTQSYQNRTGLNLLYGGGGDITVDSDKYIYTVSMDGLFVIKDRKVVAQFGKENSPLIGNWETRAFSVGFDQYGNLWVGFWRYQDMKDGYGTSPYAILPKESIDILKTNPELLYEKDSNGKYKHWKYPKWPGNLMGYLDMRILFSTKSYKGLTLEGPWERGYVGIDTKGTPSIDDDTYQQYTGFMDQDNNVLSVSSTTHHRSCLVEDKEGKIWIGTNTGVFVVEDLDQIGDNSSNYLNVIRPKVPRNDGTNYADYLLASDYILSIAVDANNRKWIATSTSGLYCVNEDGTEILQEFNKDNSPLASNVVYMVACDPLGNDVLIGTPSGQFVYSSDSAPAQDDYSEVYAFPNPVRPDYTGWITVNGLMNNSLVKITDSQGHLVWQGKSEGGMAVWDGCDTAGNRVRSGVYMVFASQNENGTSGAVTKIVVIN